MIDANALIDLSELRDSARKLLARAKELEAGPRDVWNMMLEHGWVALCLPQAGGGLAQPFSALGVVYQELGRVLAPHTLIGVSLCLGALVNFIDRDAAGELIDRTLAAKAVPLGIAMSNGLIADRDRLGGILRNVPDAGEASHLLVPIHADRLRMLLLPLPNPRVTVTYRATWDQTRRIFDVAFDDLELAGATLFDSDDGCAAASTRMTAHHDLAIACDAVGGGEAIFQDTIAYMQLRQQFNRPIASFQALKHRCADLSTTMAASHALVTASCAAFSGETGDWATSAACCRLYSSAAYRQVTEEAIQLHGGIGFTWEHHCHRFLKRARLNDVLGATPEQRQDAVAPAIFRSARSES